MSQPVANILTQGRGKKANILGQTDRLEPNDETRSEASTSLSSGDAADAPNAAASERTPSPPPAATHQGPAEPAEALPLAPLTHASTAQAQAEAEAEAKAEKKQDDAMGWASRDKKANQAHPGQMAGQGRRGNGRPLIPYFFLVAGLLLVFSLFFLSWPSNNNSTPIIPPSTQEPVSIPDPEFKMATEQT